SRDARPSEARADTASGGIDRQIGSRGTVLGRYTLNSERNRIAGSFPLLPISEQVRAQQAAIGYTAGNRSWVNDARVSFTRLRMFEVPESAFRVNVAQQLGLADTPTDPFSFGLPFLHVTTLTMYAVSPS